VYINNVDDVQISFKIFGNKKDKFVYTRSKKKLLRGVENRGCGLTDKVKDE
jgi:hypothetical protein